MPRSSLTDSVISSAKAMTLARLAATLISGIGRTLVLANLIGLDQIGIYAIATLIISFFEVFTQTGVSRALVQKRGDITRFIDTAWSIQVGRGLVLSLLICAASPWVAAWFEKPEAEGPLRVLAFLPLIVGTFNMGAAAIERDLNYRKLALLDIATVSVDVVASIGWALAVDASVWALVCGRITGQVFRSAGSFLVTDLRSKPRFHYHRYRRLRSFSFWFVLSNILAYCLFRGGDFAIGKMLPAEQLGTFFLAGLLAVTPTVELSRIVNSISFSALSRVQADAERLRRGFLRTFYVVGVLSMGSAAAIWIVADEVEELLVPGAIGLASVMRPLSLWGASRALGATNSVLFQAVGRPSLATIYQAVMLSLFAALVYPMTVRFGLTGPAILLAGVGVLVQVLRYPLTAGLIRERSLRLHAAMVPAVGAAVLAVLLAEVLPTLLGAGELDPLWRLLLTAPVGLLSFSGGLLLLERPMRHSIRTELKLLLARGSHAAGTPGDAEPTNADEA